LDSTRGTAQTEKGRHKNHPKKLQSAFLHLKKRVKKPPGQKARYLYTGNTERRGKKRPSLNPTGVEVWDPVGKGGIKITTVRLEKNSTRGGRESLGKRERLNGLPLNKMEFAGKMNN